MNYENPSLAFAEEVTVIGRHSKRACRDDHSADLDHTKICDDKFRTIREQQQHPLLPQQAQSQQSVPSPIDVGRQISVGANGFAKSNRCFSSPALPNVTVHELIGKVEDNRVS